MSFRRICRVRVSVIVPFFRFSFSVQPTEWLVAVEHTHSDVGTLEERPSIAQSGAHIREGRGPVLVTARDRPASSEFTQYTPQCI